MPIRPFSVRATLLFAAFALLCPALASAQETGRPISNNLLLTAGEWSRMCRANGREIAGCLVRLTRPAAIKAGRGGDEYIVPQPPAQTILTRSGVLMAPAINKRISAVLADTGNVTTVLLRSGEQCRVFAAHGDLLPDPRNPTAYAPLMRFITDDPDAGIESIQASRIASKPAYQFEQPQSGLLGAYIVDEKHNAGVWGICQTGDTATPGPGAQEFLAAIIGSARRY